MKRAATNINKNSAADMLTAVASAVGPSEVGAEVGAGVVRWPEMLKLE